MKAADVLAVVVNHNGRDDVREAVLALTGQVRQVHVVDNGSDADSLAVLDTLKRDHSVSVEPLGANRGIGHALNRGVARARDVGAPWLLTMDHDTVADAGLIRAYAEALDQVPDAVCLAPARDDKPRNSAIEPVAYAITAGTLVRVKVFDDIGPFDEGFFMDCIDFDFSLRLRRAGHTLYRVAAARMRHQLGEPAVVRGPAARFYARHSPVRRYYMYRNFLYLVQRHVRAFPGFVAKLAIAQIILTVLIGFFDPRPGDSYRAILRGIRDFGARKSGPYVESVS